MDWVDMLRRDGQPFALSGAHLTSRPQLNAALRVRAEARRRVDVRADAGIERAVHQVLVEIEAVTQELVLPSRYPVVVLHLRHAIKDCDTCRPTAQLEDGSGQRVVPRFDLTLPNLDARKALPARA